MRKSFIWVIITCVAAFISFSAILIGCGSKIDTDTSNDEISAVNIENDNVDTDTFNSNQTSEAPIENTIITWDEITDSGVDEELLLNNVDTEILELIANNFRGVIEEEKREEDNNPEIVLTEGWVRIFQKEKYKEVIALGKSAIKPLYLILYKSENDGLYEYLCASALQEISGITFCDEDIGTQGWSTAKEYLELFTQEILQRKYQKKAAE